MSSHTKRLNIMSLTQGFLIKFLAEHKVQGKLSCWYKRSTPVHSSNDRYIGRQHVLAIFWPAIGCMRKDLLCWGLGGFERGLRAYLTRLSPPAAASISGCEGCQTSSFGSQSSASSASFLSLPCRHQQNLKFCRLTNLQIFKSLSIGND